MPLEYTNRRGDRYYVLQGKTKTGMPKYYCSRKTQGTPVERLPEDYEINEHPRDAVVTIRRVRASAILPLQTGRCHNSLECRPCRGSGA